MNQKEKTERFRKNFMSENPLWYSGILHYMINGVFLISSTTFFFFQVTDLRAIELFVIPVILIVGNLEGLRIKPTGSIP